MGEHPGNMFSRAGQMLRGIGLSRAVTVGATVGLTSSSASYCSTTAPTTQVRIAQYNILSDSLDAPDHYIHCDPNDLDHEIRFQRVAAKLEEQMRAGAVLCLQEVSRNWAGKLIPLFEKHGYTYASALTGSKFGGYMGQCLAWPAKRFEAADISTIRVADTAEGWPKWPKPASLGWWGRLRNHKPEKLPFCPWKTAESKHNGVVLVRLVEKESKKSFVVGTYHMPCMFGSDDKPSGNAIPVCSEVCCWNTISCWRRFQYTAGFCPIRVRRTRRVACIPSSEPISQLSNRDESHHTTNALCVCCAERRRARIHKPRIHSTRSIFRVIY